MRINSIPIRFSGKSTFHKIICDQYPVESQNINPETGWPYSDVSLFQLAQQGLVQFDSSRITELPEVGSQITFDTLHSKHVSTPLERMQAMMHDYNVKHPNKEEKVDKIETKVVEPASVPELASN